MTDIIGFIKSGNLPMIHGLQRFHRLGQGILLIKGSADEFNFSKTDKVSMAEWNPLLVAIAQKRIDIVRYFLYDLNVALRHAGRKPNAEPSDSADEMAAQ